MADTYICTKCNGAGMIRYWPDVIRCSSCNGRGWDGFVDNRDARIEELERKVEFLVEVCRVNGVTIREDV